MAELIYPSIIISWQNVFSPLQEGVRIPSQVTGLSLFKEVVSGAPALRVTWTTPQSDVTITQYTVQYRRSATAIWGSQLTVSGSPPVTSAILTGLDNGTEYIVRVRAVSAVGDGMWSLTQTERTYMCEIICYTTC